jgi:hypothetical protein
MTDQTTYERARKRAISKYGFYKHVAVYAVVIVFLMVVNLVTSPQYYWFVWPMLGWGVAISIHAAKAFFLDGEEQMVERLTEKELKEEQKHFQ